MARLEKLENFIVSIEDSSSLLKLYLQRVARSPGHLSYQQALAEHAAEIRTAVETLDANITADLTSLPKRVAIATVKYVEYLVDLSCLIDEITTRMSSGQLTDMMQAIDMMRECVAALEKIVHLLSRAETADVPSTVELIANLQVLLYGEAMIFINNTNETSETIDTPVTTPTFSMENDFDEDEDPFDEMDVGGALIDELVGDLDSALDAIVQPDAGWQAIINAETEYFVESDRDQLKDLYANIAAGYLKPVKSFIMELQYGQATREWIEVCRPALASTIKAADAMNFNDVLELLDRFDALLLVVANGEERLISGYIKQEILDSYAELEAALPQAFSLAGEYYNEAAKREGIIINALLKQVKNVGTTSIRKLFTGGMTTLEHYYTAHPDDVAAITGIRLVLAERICEKFLEYRNEQLNTNRAGTRERLIELLDDLKRDQFNFRKATLEEWYTHEGSEQKALCRKERQQTMWKINLVLAEEGTDDSLALIRDLRRLIFERRIEQLEFFIEQMRG